MAKILPVRCQSCARFIAYEDLHNGKAIHRMLTPDAYDCAETWESLCPRCKENDACKGVPADQLTGGLVGYLLGVEENDDKQ